MSYKFHGPIWDVIIRDHADFNCGLTTVEVRASMRYYNPIFHVSATTYSCMYIW